MLLLIGDNFYWCGIQSTSDPLIKTDYVDPYSNSALQIPWYSALGVRILLLLLLLFINNNIRIMSMDTMSMPKLNIVKLIPIGTCLIVITPNELH